MRDWDNHRRATTENQFLLHPTTEKGHGKIMTPLAGNWRTEGRKKPTMAQWWSFFVKKLGNFIAKKNWDVLYTVYILVSYLSTYLPTYLPTYHTNYWGLSTTEGKVSSTTRTQLGFSSHVFFGNRGHLFFVDQWLAELVQDTTQMLCLRPCFSKALERSWGHGFQVQTAEMWICLKIGYIPNCSH